ncbi:hypothetical protein DENSPDRAFT_771943 [Dentipellis sp. KUC8613]|nr:hypothetical protein DENSPDRAFT_771943 [Dentipellis sp. KUC8613]
MYRPSTSKPRGICKYYTSPRGCFQGDRCKFLHGEQETLTPYDKSKTCRYFAQGYCKRGADCWFRHVVPDANTPGAAHAPPPMTADATICGICLEEPTTFGLLSGCSHIFCCLRNWRDREGKNEEMLFSHVNKKCPYCRTFSKSVTPSSHFYPDGHPGKAAAIERHKASTSRIPCRYFQESQPNDRFCPFGRDCIYLHENEDGTPYIFHAGVDHYMRVRHNLTLLI